MSHPAFAPIASASAPHAHRRVLAVATALIAGTVFIAAPRAQAVDKAVDPAPHEVRGIKLATICSACGVVSDVRAETREGPHDAKGAVAGAVVGGLAGHGIGNGSGRTAATVIGAIGGGLAGNAVEKKVNRETVWTTTVVFKDGAVRSYEHSSAPGVDPGDIVVIADGHPARVEQH